MSRRSEISAGILAYRRKPRLEFLLAHPGGPYWQNKDEGAWSIPKGNVESGDLLACARREFNEETGLLAEGPFNELTPVRQKSGKIVHAFAIEADFDLDSFLKQQVRNGVAAALGQAAELSRESISIAYFSLATARRKILPGQRPFIEELMARLKI